MNVYFLGRKLTTAINGLNTYNGSQKKLRKFLVFHWSPSEIISKSAKYREVTMPKCELYKNDTSTKCRYDITPVLIFFNEAVRESDDLMDIIKRVHFRSLESIIEVYEEFSPKIQNLLNTAAHGDKTKEIEKYYDQIACRWLKANVDIYNYQGHEDSWIQKIDETREISIGGM